MRKNIVCGISLLALAVFLSAVPMAAGAEPAVKTDDSVVRVQSEGRPVFEYHYAGVPFKPYVQAFFSPGGNQILRDAPHDHLHHHALMFALAVDGVNFWEEAKAPGRQVHRSFGEPAGAKTETGQAGFTEQLDWLKPDSEDILLKEQRTIAAATASDLGASLMTWTSVLGVPEGKNSAELTGAHYYGLGMRFVESMDKVGTFFNAADAEGESVRGTEKLTRAAWCAYTAEVDGKPVTVAMFADPKNARHPAYWFTMTDPFSYLAATLNLWKEPMTLKSGESLTLRYGVALWDGRVDKGVVEKVYQRWLSSVK